MGDTFFLQNGGDDLCLHDIFQNGDTDEFLGVCFVHTGILCFCLLMDFSFIHMEKGSVTNADMGAIFNVLIQNVIP